MNTISTTNWNYCFYSQPPYMTFISIGGEFGESNTVETFYYVTTTNIEETQEHFQRKFSDLSSAIDFINKRFGHLEIKDSKNLENNARSGCGTCCTTVDNLQ